MKLSIIIPDRPGREALSKICRKYIERQTLQPDSVHFIDYPAEEGVKFDLVARVKEGCRAAIYEQADLICIMENDDWYSPRYLQNLVAKWKKEEEPALIGQNQTYYYHLLWGEYRHMLHLNRASLFTTAFTAEIAQSIVHGNIKEPFLDMWLWERNRKASMPYEPLEVDAIGLKHNIGYAGGKGHTAKGIYNSKDPDRTWLKAHIGHDIANYEYLMK